MTTASMIQFSCDQGHNSTEELPLPMNLVWFCKKLSDLRCRVCGSATLFIGHNPQADAVAVTEAPATEAGA